MLSTNRKFLACCSCEVLRFSPLTFLLSSADVLSYHRARLKERIQEKDEVARDLESQNLSLDRKCQRLRDYIRKLTMKCEEWAEYSEKQSEAIKKAKDRQQAGIETGAHTLSCSKTVAETPHGAAAQESSQDRSRWSVERRMLDRVANLAATLD